MSGFTLPAAKRLFVTMLKLKELPMRNKKLLGCGLLAVATFCLSGIDAAASAVPSEFSRKSPLQWSVGMADSEMARLGNRLAWTPGGTAKWDYATGLFTLSLLELNERVNDPARFEFVTNAIGTFISADGNIQSYKMGEYQLDAINPGKTALALWQITKEDRYKKAAARLRNQLDVQPRTGSCGFWHKQRYTNQMWLDGLFMAAPFYAEHAKLFHETASSFDDVARQFRLINQHAYDARRGLFYHGQDEAKTQTWASPVTGCSSNFWGRAICWYAMALVDTLDFFPTNHPVRAELISTFQKLSGAVIRYQDPATGLWWQVMDQGKREGNYLEATDSAMFVYALAKGINEKYLTHEYADPISKGYQGMIENFVKTSADGQVSLTHCCQVAGLGFTSNGGRPRDGSFDYYVSEPIVENDLKGIGPFILAGLQLQKIIDAQARPENK
jgi:unsaturated rhamnogalacturonyl hydrolase